MRITLGIILSAAMTVTAAHAELALPLKVEVGFHSLSGEKITTIDPDQSFVIALEYRRSDAEPLPAELAPHGWLRPKDADNTSCEAAARQFSLSTHILPRGVIDLTRTLIGVSAEDGSFSIVDPELNLASANIVAAAQLGAVPDALEADRTRGRFLATFSERGEVVEIDSDTGQTETIATALDRPAVTFTDPFGGIWIDERGAGRLLRLGADGSEVMATEQTAAVSSNPDRSKFATVTQSGITTISASSLERRRFPQAQVTAAVPLGHHSPFAVAALTADGQLRVFDPAARSMLLPTPATHLAQDSHGRWLAAYAPGTASSISLIDLVAGELRQVIPVGSEVTEVAFAHGSLFIMTADQAMIRAVDLTAQNDAALPVRRLSIGRPSSNLVADGLIAPLDDGHGIVAVHKETYTGFLIHPAMTKTDMPPMHPIKLRGGVPARITSMVRDFEDAGDGRFQTVARLGEESAYELVIASGVPGRVACITVPTSYLAQAETRQIRIVENGVDLRLIDNEGEPLEDANVEILIAGLRTPYREFQTLTTTQDGRLPGLAMLEIPKPFSISVRLTQSGKMATYVSD